MALRPRRPARFSAATTPECSPQRSLNRLRKKSPFWKNGHETSSKREFRSNEISVLLRCKGRRVGLEPPPTDFFRSLLARLGDAVAWLAPKHSAKVKITAALAESVAIKIKSHEAL